MSEMTDIPSDVLETAHYAVGYKAFKDAAVYGTGMIDSQMVEVVARAIMAERRRCAKIAYAHVSEPGLSDNPAYTRVAQQTCADIAAAIRSGEKQT